MNDCQRYSDLLDRFWSLTPEEDAELRALSRRNLQELYRSIGEMLFHNGRGGINNPLADIKRAAAPASSKGAVHG